MSSDPIETLNAASEEMRRLYWKEKNLPESLQVAREGIEQGEKAAKEFPEQQEEILSGVKRLCFDIASFTWIGWDEPGISPTSEERAEGLSAARKNLEYAVQLKSGDLPTSRAYWIIGAHLLTAGQPQDALGDFRRAEELARSAGEEGEEQLCRGFAMLAEAVIEGRIESAAITEQLSAMDADPKAAPFSSQIRTVARLLGIQGVQS